MEGLTKRDKDLKIIPGLAERWEIVDPSSWRFYLRKGVKFHNGEDFTADDVVFSAERMRSARLPHQDARARRYQGRQGRRLHGRFRADAPQSRSCTAEWDTWYILSKKWAEANGADAGAAGSATHAEPPRSTPTAPGRSSIVSHEPGVKTVFKPNPELVGQAGAQSRRGDLHDHQVGRDARRRAAVRRRRLDRPGAGAGHRAHQDRPEREGDDRARSSAPSSSASTSARRAAILQRQGQEPLQGRARAQGLLSGDRHRGDRTTR